MFLLYVASVFITGWIRPGAEVQKMQLKVCFAAIAVSGNAWINVSARLN
jgi:hypothetical protein